MYASIEEIFHNGLTYTIKGGSSVLHNWLYNYDFFVCRSIKDNIFVF